MAKVPSHVVDQLRDRAIEAGFDGTILVGQKDGSHSVFAIGENPPSTRAVWRWASITKQLAAVLAMQEIERGRLDLDAPVSRYWRDWKAPYASTIRIRDLLLHNSGLPQPDESQPDSDGVPAFYRSAAAVPAASASGYCAGPARAAPPAPFEYNNCDTIVLAEVLAKVTGRSFDRLMHERFGKKLGLKSVGIYGIEGRRFDHVAPTGEYRDVDALINLGVNGASAGAYGTITDLWKFDHALLSGKLLGSKARETMWQSSRENGYYGFFQWIYPAPLKGCAKDVRIVERQGLVGGIELRNYLLPESGQALIIFGRKRPVGIGDPWEGKGFAFDLLSSIACRSDRK
ncbi:MAG: beta-lactamase family protein [Sphingomonadaceae bacterium]|nr:beta-lactamase family protein [Sphingomonadaceae bacterium]